MFRVCMLILTAMSAIACAGGMSSEAASKLASQPTSRPAFTLGYDTTRITRPLLPDGRPDYVEALNEAYGKGVTLKNNAAISLLEAFGPEMLVEKTRPAVLKRLGFSLPKKGRYFKAIPDDPDVEISYQDAQKAPWRAKEHPKLAAWLKDNAALIPGPAQRGYRDGAKALIVRANLALAEGRTDDAWADILAVHRLAALMEQDWSPIGQLVGVAIHGQADKATVRMATSGKVKVGRLRRMLKELPACGSARTLPASVNKSDRYGMLDLAISLTRDLKTLGKEMVQLVEPEGGSQNENFSKQIEQICKSGVNRDTILHRSNCMYDLVVKAMRLPTHAQRRKAFQDIDNETDKISKEAATLPLGKHAEVLAGLDADGSAATRWMGSFLVCMFPPVSGRAQTLAERAVVRRDLSVLSIGLAIHRAENGRYPQRLNELSPKVLKTIPKDFFSDKPYVYKRKDAGYILYSVGDNGADDDGTDREAGGDDIVVTAEK